MYGTLMNSNHFETVVLLQLFNVRVKTVACVQTETVGSVSQYLPIGAFNETKLFIPG